MPQIKNRYWLQFETKTGEVSNIGEYSSKAQAKHSMLNIFKTSSVPLAACHIMTLDVFGEPMTADYYRVDGDYSNCSNI